MGSEMCIRDSSTISAQFKNGMFGEGILGFNELNMSQSVSYTHLTLPTKA